MKNLLNLGRENTYSVDVVITIIAIKRENCCITVSMYFLWTAFCSLLESWNKTTLRFHRRSLQPEASLCSEQNLTSPFFQPKIGQQWSQKGFIKDRASAEEVTTQVWILTDALNIGSDCQSCLYHMTPAGAKTYKHTCSSSADSRLDYHANWLVVKNFLLKREFQNCIFFSAYGMNKWCINSFFYCFGSW